MSVRVNGRVRSCALVALAVCSMAACVEPGDEAFEGVEATRSNEVRNGFTASQTGMLESIVRISNESSTSMYCTGTLISEYTILLAAHCVADDETGQQTRFRARATFPNSRGHVVGDVVIHPRFREIKWMAHDYAVIQLDTSIHDASTLNSTGLVPIPVEDDQVSTPTNVTIAGYGHRNGSCGGGVGVFSMRTIQADSQLEDWHYRTNHPLYSTCEGDSGSALLTGSGSSYKVIGVTSWGDGNKSYFKPSYAAYDWINLVDQRTDLQGSTWGDCILYDDDNYYSSRKGNHSNLGSWDNRATSVWVKQGYRLRAYDYVNYGTEQGSKSGIVNYDGQEYCNEFGCLHDLTGTSMYKDISSLKCERDLPGDTWGYCVGYTRYYTGNYISTQGNQPLLSSSGWDNTITHFWVKNGHTATLWPEDNYSGNGYWNGITLNGTTSGGITNADCNSHGCLHDLTGTYHENTVNSFQCN